MKKTTLFLVLLLISCKTNIINNNTDCLTTKDLKTLVPMLTEKIKSNHNFSLDEKILLIKTYNTSCFNHIFKDEILKNYLWDFYVLFDKIKYKLIEEFEFEFEFSETYYSSRLNMRIGVVNNYDENSYIKIKENNCDLPSLDR
jgi:hypothetical protein